MAQYSLASYFQNMKTIGNPLKAVDEENFKQLREIEEEIQEFAQKALAAGKPDEKVNERGEMTALQRIAELIDEGTWCSTSPPRSTDFVSVWDCVHRASPTQ